MKHRPTATEIQQTKLETFYIFWRTFPAWNENLFLGGCQALPMGQYFLPYERIIVCSSPASAVHEDSHECITVLQNTGR
jgi:hypothetical protein